jgi:tight adherence protein C
MLAAVSIGVGLAALGWLLVLADPERLSLAGVRGLNRRASLQRYPAWQALQPLVVLLGAYADRVLSRRVRARLDRFLTRCGNPLGLTAGELLGLCALSVAGGLGLGAALARWLGVGATLVGILVPMSAALPWLLHSQAGARRSEQISKALPHALELLALAMSAGLDFKSALVEFSRRGPDLGGPLSRELGAVLHELRVGRTRWEALEGLRDRVASESIAEFVGAVGQAERHGTPLADVLRVQARAARHRESTRAEQAAARAGVRMIAPLFLLLLSVLLLVMGPMLMSLSGPGAAPSQP